MTASIAHDSNLTCAIPSGCPCPGETVSCECIAVAGTQSIEWSGSIFEGGDERCNSISVLIDGTPEECNGIKAYGYSTPDGHFISNMNLTANPRYNSKTVQCRIVHGNEGQLRLVGSVTINTTPGG